MQINRLRSWSYRW